MSTHPLFGEVISSYSRREAIDDGTLIDLMQDEGAQMIRDLGFRFDVAMTAAVWQTAIEPSDSRLPVGQDRNGRLWDVLWMLRVAIRSAPPGSRSLRFQVWVSNFNGERTKVALVQLKALSGPGDQGEPTITIMLPEED